MAHIRKRGKSWYYTIDTGNDPVTGKRKQQSKGGFKTRKDAELAAARAETELSDGVFTKEKNTTFESFASLWLDLYRQEGHKKSSLKQREYQIGVLNGYFGKMKLKDISRKRYEETLLLFSAKLSRSTTASIHGVAKMIFRKALNFGEMKIDPTEFSRISNGNDERPEKELPKYLEKEQLAEFLDLAKTRGLHDDYLSFLLMAYTGIRVGELCALKWSSVDFGQSLISIVGTLYSPNDGATNYEVTSPKTKSSKRTILVDQAIMHELQQHRIRQNQFRMKHRQTYHDADFVFGRMDDHYGYPLLRQKVEYRMERLAKWMNINFPLTPHVLRHTHTSLLAEAGAELQSIMERLGHKNDTITRTVYMHVTKQLKRDTADKFSNLMSNVIKM